MISQAAALQKGASENIKISCWKASGPNATFNCEKWPVHAN